jgi:rhodanese-related sulfurtransferase
VTKKTYYDITLPELKLLKEQPGIIVVDVREPWEFDEFNEGGINIPLAKIRERRAAIIHYTTIIVVCTNGVRSKVAAMDYCRVTTWEDKKILHLHGGILEVE